MGTLYYGGFDIEIEDRLLAHLQIVVVNKLRRNEPLLMSWLDDPSIGDGRSAVWLSPSVPVYFKFAGSRSPAIDPGWLARMQESANGPRGLVLQDANGVVAHAMGTRDRTPVSHRHH